MNFTVLKEKWSNYIRWQKEPYTPNAISAYSQNECNNCGESFEGAFCPRCGQSASIKRLSFNSLILQTADVWGMGNRSMPRLLGHLLSRPGYMIRDYIKGHRQPYFPPIKTIFILTTIYILLVNLLPLNVIDNKIEEVGDNNDKDKMVIHIEDINAKETAIYEYRVKKAVSVAYDWFSGHKAISLLVMVVFSALLMRLFFRRSPRMGKLNVTEHFFAQVLIANQFLLLGIIFTLITWRTNPMELYPIPYWLMIVMNVINYRQLHGYGYFSTLVRTLAVQVFISFIGILIIFIGIIVLTLVL